MTLPYRPEQGDWRIAESTVTPFDGTSAAVLTVYPATGATFQPTLTPNDDIPSTGIRTYVALGYEFATGGEYIERWAYTGTGRGKEREVLLVAPAAEEADLRPVYATTADYASYLRAAPPAGARRALREASGLVDELLLTAFYAVDADDLPTDAVVAAAMRDATCAQADYMRAAGDRYGIGAAVQYGNVSIGSVSLGRASAAAGSGGGAGRYSPRALSILRQAGLTAQGPIIY